MRAVRLTVYLAAPIVFCLIPTSFFQTGRTLCLFKNLFGTECPGCGLTRSFSALVHGDILSAISFNASVVIVFPLLCFVLAKAIACELKGIALLDASRSILRFRMRT